MSELVPFNVPFGGDGEDGSEFEFTVRLCHDVLMEALYFGDRRQITKLERGGRRFHRTIEDFFKQIPFLRLNLTIDQCNRVSINGKKMSLTGLTTFPPFLRFGNVEIWRLDGSQPIGKKCEFIESQLRPLKSALNDSNMVEFRAFINQNGVRYLTDVYGRRILNDFHFTDHLQLLQFIRTRLLSICDSSRGYKFDIILYPFFHYGENSASKLAKNLIASLLQMDEVKLCSNVEIQIYNAEQNQLPVEAIEEISNWLERPINGKGNYVRNQMERSLKICIPCTHIQNAQEMVNHLKTKFIGAKFPVHPFNFCLACFDVKTAGIEAQTLTNKKTGEELLVQRAQLGLELQVVDAIEIKRRPNKKPNKPNKKY